MQRNGATLLSVCAIAACTAKPKTDPPVDPPVAQDAGSDAGLCPPLGDGGASMLGLPNGTCSPGPSCQYVTLDCCPDGTSGPQITWSCDCKSNQWACEQTGQGRNGCPPLTCPWPVGQSSEPFGRSSLPDGGCSNTSSCAYFTQDACSNGAGIGPMTQWTCSCSSGTWACNVAGRGPSSCSSEGSICSDGATCEFQANEVCVGVGAGQTCDWNCACQSGSWACISQGCSRAGCQPGDAGIQWQQTGTCPFDAGVNVSGS